MSTTSVPPSRQLNEDRNAAKIAPPVATPWAAVADPRRVPREGRKDSDNDELPSPNAGRQGVPSLKRENLSAGFHWLLTGAKSPWNLRTATSVDIPDVAPRACVERDAAQTAQFAASRRDSPFASALPSAPTKVSPAPVVSTTFTEGTGIWVVSPLSQIRAPRPPRVTTREAGAFRLARTSPSRAGSSGTEVRRWTDQDDVQALGEGRSES